MYKDYLIIVDGLKVGIIPLTREEVINLTSDENIKIMEVK